MTKRAVQVGILGVAVMLAVGCGNGDDDGGPATSGGSLVHTWEYLSAAGTSGAGLTFTSDGKYQAVHLVLTSSTSGDVQEETGTGPRAAPQTPQTGKPAAMARASDCIASVFPEKP